MPQFRDVDTFDRVVPDLPGFNTKAGMVGDIATTVIDWFAWQVPDTRLVYEVPVPGGEPGEYEQEPHEALDVLDYASGDVDGDELSRSYTADLLYGGRTQLLKLRNGSGRVVGVRWLPTATTKPILPRNRQPIEAFRVAGMGGDGTVPRDDVVYFRYMLQPTDQRTAVGPLETVARELLGDQLASAITTAMLRNHALPSVILAPDWSALPGDAEVQPIDSSDAQSLKGAYKGAFGGSSTGDPMVAEIPLTVTQLDPHFRDWDMAKVRGFFETRVCARFRLPTIVVGFQGGDGLPTYANFETAQRIAYVNGLIPLQKGFARKLTNEFLIEFDPPPGARLRYDYSETAAMQENQNDLVTRQRGLIRDSVATLDEVQTRLGYDVIPGGPWRVVPAYANIVRDVDIEAMADETLAGEDPIGPAPRAAPVSPDDPPEPPEPTDPDA